MGWPSPRRIGVSPCLLSCLEFHEPPGDNAQSGPIGHDTKTWEPRRVVVDGAEIRGSPVEGKLFYPTIDRVLNIPGGCLGFLNYQQYHGTTRDRFCPIQRISAFFGSKSKLFVSIMVLEYGWCAVLLQIVIDSIRLYTCYFPYFKYHLTSHHITTTHPYLRDRWSGL